MRQLYDGIIQVFKHDDASILHYVDIHALLRADRRVRLVHHLDANLAVSGRQCSERLATLQIAQCHDLFVVNLEMSMVALVPQRDVIDQLDVRLRAEFGAFRR